MNRRRAIPVADRSVAIIDDDGDVSRDRRPRPPRPEGTDDDDYAAAAAAAAAARRSPPPPGRRRRRERGRSRRRDSRGRRRRRPNKSSRAVLLAAPLVLLLLSLLSPPDSSRAVSADSSSDRRALFDVEDGTSNLKEGLRLFDAGRYDDASPYLWRAVVLQTQGENSKLYEVDDAFTPFLQCYLQQGKIVDGLVFISAEGYLRGQDSMGELYLGQALQRDPDHAGALELKEALESRKGEDDKPKKAKNNARKFKWLKEIRDRHDLSKRQRSRDISSENADEESGTRPRTKWNEKSSSFPSVKDMMKDIEDESPEEIYNVGTVHFNSKDFVLAERLFQLSCEKSNSKLEVACTNAIYLRTNLCDWGHRGERFEKDMRVTADVTRAETREFRSVKDDAGDEARRLAGMGRTAEEEVIHWQRSTSIHPHMMLGFPLGNENAILKRYTAESLAGLDELRARLDDDGGFVRPRPKDLPYDVEDMRRKFLEKRERTEDDPPPIRVGFVACSFNSKAVLFLSHDMFRFFDPSLVEIHVFSTGPPDNPHFVKNVMRGVDWRQRVIDAVDYFHDVREYQLDHIGLARFIRELEMQILVEWDGYARQGQRAAGLMALRPAPIQVLHQEFLMTSGAHYFDYIVTDEVVSPLTLEGLYAEKFLYLPNHFFSKGHAVQEEVIPPRLDYTPRGKGAKFRLGVGTPQENACLSSSPLGTNVDDGKDRDVSFVYCNFNKFLKNNPETMRSWIRILREVPDSILCLLENPPEGVSNLRRFVAEVADDVPNLNDRIHFIPWEMNPFDHQRRSYSLCNVMLDSHPYNGHTTAQDALYAGVPIVTRSDGIDMSSRVSTSANAVLGLEELNARGGTEQYENIAIRLGKDEAWFNSTRARLVETCLRKDPMHPYWDVPRYVDNFQNGLKMVWDRFLDGKETDHVEVVEKVDSQGKPRGTTQAELAAREERRRELKGNRKGTKNDEL